MYEQIGNRCFFKWKGQLKRVYEHIKIMQQFPVVLFCDKVVFSKNLL